MYRYTDWTRIGIDRFKRSYGPKFAGFYGLIKRKWNNVPVTSLKPETGLVDHGVLVNRLVHESYFVLHLTKIGQAA